MNKTEDDSGSFKYAKFSVLVLLMDLLQKKMKLMRKWEKSWRANQLSLLVWLYTTQPAVLWFFYLLI